MTCSREQESAPHVVVSAEEFLSLLKASGSYRSGDNGSDPTRLPIWVDYQKLKTAKQIFKRNLFGLYFCHLSGLTTLVHVKSILEPLVETKQSASVALLFRRYLGTLTHVKTWYDGRVWVPEDNAFKSVMLVRKMHRMVAEKLNAELEVGVPLKISQYDMLITQFAFIGLAVLMPKKFGIDWDDNELDCVLHFWRLIGYLLGVEDEYNLFSHPLPLIKEMCGIILEKDMKSAFTEGGVGSGEKSSQSRQMSRGILESIRPYVPLIRWDSYLKYLANILDCNEKNMKLSFKANLVYNSMSITLRHLHRSDSISLVLNRLLIRAISKAHRKRVKIAQRLEKKYADYIL